MYRIILIIVFTLATTFAMAAEPTVSFKSNKSDPMYYEGFDATHPPTKEQAAIIEKRDGPEFAEYGIDPEYCQLWSGVDARCFIGDAFKCWDS